ncbi:hypothetical protein GF354_00300 [Candidatus Peregrinibacteria bacterium]|nr:hypothetical protein [Candidatus Peregrinibacteria bacterium]
MYISLDLETTGFSPDKDKIIEFGAVKFDKNGISERLQFFVNPDLTLPQLITHITNIKDEDLKDAPHFEEKIDEVQNFIGSLPIIGHNIQFDIGFLEANGVKISNPLFDTHILSSILVPSLPSYSLEILSKIFHLKHEDKHRALDDSIAAMELFLELQKKFECLPEELLNKLKDLSQKSEWDLKHFFKTLKPHKQDCKIDTYKEESEKSSLEKNIHKKILELKESTLIDIPGPYARLSEILSKKIEKNDFISLPHRLFKKVISLLPDTIAKLDTPENYLSITRLNKFEKKEVYSPAEISALLKILIWKDHTATGLLSELALIHDEKKVIYKINADPQITVQEEETFLKKAHEKEKAACTICTHEYIINSPIEADKLIIIDIDNFAQTLYYSQSIFLNIEKFTAPLKELKELFPENQIIDTLLSKATILFGLIGILHEKQNDKNKYTDRCTADNFNISSKEWNDVINSINQLIKESKNLIELMDDSILGHLQTWKSHLKEMHEIFKNPQINDNLVFIEKDHNGNPIFKKSPYNIKPEMDKILDKSKTPLIIGNNLDLNDDGEFSKKFLNLNEDIKFKNFTTKREDLEIFIIENTDPEKISPELIKFLQQEKGETAFLINSKAQMEYFTLELSGLLPETSIISQRTGSIGKISEQYKENPANSLLITTPYSWEKLDPNLDFKNLIISKIPFAPPSNPYIMTAGKKFPNEFMDFSLPLSAKMLKKIIDRLKLSPKQSKQVYILDPRLTEKDYGKVITNILPTLARTNFIDIASLPANVKPIA